MAQNKVPSWALFNIVNPMKLRFPCSIEQEEIYSMELTDGLMFN
jgi:hypothetical protein